MLTVTDDCVSGAIVVGLKCSKKCMLGYGNSSARSSFSYAMQRSKAEQPLLCPLVRFSAAAAKQPSSRLDKIRHIIRSSAVATTKTPTALPYSTFVHQAFRLQFFDVAATKQYLNAVLYTFQDTKKVPSFFALLPAAAAEASAEYLLPARWHSVCAALSRTQY